MRKIYQAGPFSQMWSGRGMVNFPNAYAQQGTPWSGRETCSRRIKSKPLAPKRSPLSLKHAATPLIAVPALSPCLTALKVDDGTAWEIGYAYAKGLPIFGIRTDCRQGGDTQFNHVNSMIEGCLYGLATDVDGLLLMMCAASCSGK